MRTSVAIVLALMVVPLAGQSPATPPSSSSKAPRTPWGHPDLEGIWSYATVTPLERPDAQAGREFLSADEVKSINEDAATRADRRSKDPRADVEGAYNAFWWDRGGSTGRTSLIIDPPSGKLPALTPEAQRRRAERAASQRNNAYDSYETRPLQERCITYHGVPPLPSGYNNTYQITQTRDFVAILDENIHDMRVIPLDGRPHPPASVRKWNGDSRGRWEGDTLVVETTNYHPNTTLRYPIDYRTLKATERFRRIAPDKIEYRYTIDDPSTYTSKWTVELPLNRVTEPIYEYACHEGNYGLAHVLMGARAQDNESR